MMERTDILAAYKNAFEFAKDHVGSPGEYQSVKLLSVKEFEELLEELCSEEYWRGFDAGSEHGYRQGYDHAAPDPFD